jgi:hypothetical protein
MCAGDHLRGRVGVDGVVQRHIPVNYPQQAGTWALPIFGTGPTIGEKG